MDTAKGELVATNGAPAPRPAPAANDIAMARLEGFEGIASAPFSEKVQAILAAPIDPEMVEIRPDGIVYLPAHGYRRRLFEAFGAGGWALAPRGPVRKIPDGGADLVVWPGALVVNGRFIAEAHGECKYWPPRADKQDREGSMSYADAIEGAKTNCLERCCKDIMPGILCLWDPGWREAWIAKYAQQVMKQTRFGDKKVWQRKGRRAAISAAPATASAMPPAPSESATEPLSTPTEASPPSTTPDTGEAATDGQLDQLRDKVRELKWKAQFVKTWFTNRFGIWPPESLTTKQVETAFYLLETWREPDGGDLYREALNKAKAEGRCR